MNTKDKIEAVKRLVNPYADKHLLHEIEELKAKLMKERLYVVVIGLFKWRKSTLINA